MEPVLARWDRSPDLAVHGVSFLLYGLLDVVVDGYFDAVQQFDEYYDEVSEGIFAETADSSRPSRSTGSRCARRLSDSTGWSCRCAKRSAG